MPPLGHLPARFAPSIPEQDDVTLFEASNRLVGRQSSTGLVSHLLYPSIAVDLSAIDSALLSHIPSLEVQQRLSGSQHDKQQTADGVQVPGWLQLPVSLLSAGRRAVLSRLPGPWQVLDHQAPPPQLLAWSPSQPVLAVGHSSSGAVLLYNCASAAASAASAGSTPDVLHQPQQVLVHQLQHQVSSLAWRPVHASMLAVGCRGGVALWNLGRLPLSSAAMSGSGSAAAAWVTFLPFRPGSRVSSLTWSPDGMRLAGSSADCNRIMVWDVALGVGAKLRLGLVPVHLLSWSPDGNYLFAADRSGQFFLYETVTWTMRQWVSPAGSAISGAAWAPDSSVLLLSSSGSNFLVGLHIVGQQPTKLTEQLLPVALPGISDRELTMDLPGPTDSPTASEQSAIAGLCWDRTGNRLAVQLKSPHAAAGMVALYSTTIDPVVTCHLVGYVNAGQGAVVSKSSSGSADGGVLGDDDGVRARVVASVFAPVSGKAEAAGLLSVGVAESGGGSSGEVCRVVNVPIY